MKKVLSLVALVGLLSFVGCVTTQQSSQQSEWKNALLVSLQKHYQITTRNWLGKIKEAGTVLAIQQDGFLADFASLAMTATEILDGKIVSTGGGGLILGTGARSLKKGERVHIYDIRVKDAYVLFLVGTVETFDHIESGETKADVIEAAIMFRFEKETLANMSADEVIAKVNPWLATPSEASASKAISLGQTVDDVVKILGQPSKTVNLGAKNMYFYENMKVIFVDGKVTDVQ